MYNMSVAGTPKKLMLDGESFDVIAAAEFTLDRTKFKKEQIETSGEPIVKLKKNTQIAEAEIACNSKKYESLMNKVNSLADITISFTLADGSVYKGKGQVEAEAWAAQDNKTKIKMIPTAADGWTAFPV